MSLRTSESISVRNNNNLYRSQVCQGPYFLQCQSMLLINCIWLERNVRFFTSQVLPLDFIWARVFTQLLCGVIRKVFLRRSLWQIFREMGHWRAVLHVSCLVFCFSFFFSFSLQFSLLLRISYPLAFVFIFSSLINSLFIQKQCVF